jgi:antitoxin (DNA-binding transcriptional repressor) of toxin-antitoxin stability system
VIVTKRGRPIARLGPVAPEDARPTPEGSVLEGDDIVGPFHDAWRPAR